MLRMFFPLCLIFFVHCSQKNQSHHHLDVVGGRYSDDGDLILGRLVGLFDSESKPFCSGVIFSPDIVLTAAHCMAGKDITQVRMARWSAQKRVFEQGLMEIREADFFAPSIGDMEFPNFDLVKLRLMEPFTFSMPAMSIASHIEENTAVWIAGFGQSSTTCGQIKDPPLSCMGLPKYTKMMITEKIDGPRFMNLLKLKGEGSGPCMGDSGGPVFYYKDDQIQLVGIISGVWHVFNEAVSHSAQQICESAEALASSAVGTKAWIETKRDVEKPSHENPQDFYQHRPGSQSGFSDWCLYQNTADPAWRTTQTILYHIAQYASEDYHAKTIFEDCDLAAGLVQEWMGPSKVIEFDRSSRFFSDLAPIVSLNPLHLGFYFNDLGDVNLSGLHSVRSILIQSSFISQESLCQIGRMKNLEKLRLEYLKSPVNLSCLPNHIEVNIE